MQDTIQLSLIIPVYNAADFIAQTAKTLVEFLNSSKLRYEIIFVDDGSKDNSVEILSKHSTLGPLQVLRLPENQGKFAAIKKGIEVAQGECCVFTDADLPYDLNALPYMYELLSTGSIHLAIGDRRLAHSHSIVPTTLLRKFASFILASIIRLLMTGGLHDSQCGLKGFRSDVAKEIFSMLRYKRFAGDIEILYIALKHNLTIKRIPVRLVNSAPSTVRVQLDFFGFLLCIATMRINWDLGRYFSEKLDRLANRIYWDKDLN